MADSPITAPAPVPSIAPIDNAAPSLKPLSRDHARELTRQARDAARRLKKLATKFPGMIAMVEGKTYPRVEAWQFVGACFGHTALITSTEELRSDAGEATGYIAVAHIRNQAGQIISGAEAVCMREEPDWAVSPAFQLRSMAQTRAESKAFRNVFAWVMLLAGFCPTPAEEMELGRGESHVSQMTGKKCHECGNQLSDKRWRDTRKKYAKALCLEHEKAEKEKRSAQIMNPVNDPAFVEQSVRQVKARLDEKKAAQPIVEILDATPKHKDAYSL